MSGGSPLLVEMEQGRRIESGAGKIAAVQKRQAVGSPYIYEGDKMKGRNVKYLPAGGLEIIEFDVPDPGPGEVQVQGTACGVCAWDLYTYRHGSNAPSAAPPGHEGIGYVIKVGAGVTSLHEGDRVAGGGFATVHNDRADTLYLMPPSRLPDEYWVVEPLSCVVTGTDHCNLRIGDRVAVVGCGFMGLLMVACLARSYAQELIAIDIVPERLELARRYGAQRIINSAAPGLDDRVRELKELGIDCVVDASGAQAGLDLSTRIVRRGGRINLFGWIHGQATFSGDAWHGMGITVVCSSPSARIRDPFPVAIRLIADGLVDTQPVVTHVVPLEEADALMGAVTRKELPDYIKGIIRLN
jgi:threonine dehydrogenase-like Zn-dependent dehydrogenase